MENYDTNQGHGESNYEETPTGYDLTLRKVVQQRPIAGMDQNMNAISGQAGQFRKLKFEGAQVPANSNAVRTEFNKMKGLLPSRDG